jgi:hypothetical protein
VKHIGGLLIKKDKKLAKSVKLKETSLNEYRNGILLSLIMITGGCTTFIIGALFKLEILTWGGLLIAQASIIALVYYYIGLDDIRKSEYN